MITIRDDDPEGIFDMIHNDKEWIAQVTTGNNAISVLFGFAISNLVLICLKFTKVAVRPKMQFKKTRNNNFVLLEKNRWWIHHKYHFNAKYFLYPNQHISTRGFVRDYRRIPITLARLKNPKVMTVQQEIIFQERKKRSAMTSHTNN